MFVFDLWVKPVGKAIYGEKGNEVNEVSEEVFQRLGEEISK